MISVMAGSASSASSGPRPNTSSRTESTRRSLSFLVIVIAVERKYSSASSRIFSRTPGLLLESIWSANFSIRRAWIWTLAAVKAGVRSPPTAAAARCDNDGVGGAATAAAWASGLYVRRGRTETDHPHVGEDGLADDLGRPGGRGRAGVEHGEARGGDDGEVIAQGDVAGHSLLLTGRNRHGHVAAGQRKVCRSSARRHKAEVLGQPVGRGPGAL